MRFRFISLIASVVLILTSCGGSVPAGVQLWPDGPYWAEVNVGASHPWEYGEYFAWGETESKEVFSWKTYSLDAGDVSAAIESAQNPILKSPYDAATVNMGAEWRIPTDSEWQELVEKCNWTWTEFKGVSGYEVKGPNGNAIFLPAGGYHTGDRLRDDRNTGDYWSSSPSMDDTAKAGDLYFNSEYAGIYSSGRDCGRLVRALRPAQ